MCTCALHVRVCVCIHVHISYDLHDYDSCYVRVSGGDFDITMFPPDNWSQRITPDWGCVTVSHRILTTPSFTWATIMVSTTTVNNHCTTVNVS